LETEMGQVETRVITEDATREGFGGGGKDGQLPAAVVLTNEKTTAGDETKSLVV